MAELNREELPQELWKKERFESQYVPNYKMSNASKAYEKLHNIRSGMETLPLTLGTNIIGDSINTVASLGGSVLPKYRNVPSSINPSDISMEDMLRWFDDLGNDSKNYQLVDVLDNYDNSDDWYKEFQTTLEGDKYLENHKEDRKLNTYKQNFANNKNNYNNIRNVFKKALGIADIASKVAASNLAGKLINKLEDNWYEPSAKIIYKNVREYLPEEGVREIEEKGLTSALWYKWVDPEILIIDEPKYQTTLSNDDIMEAYNLKEDLDYLPARPEYWDNLNDRAKLKYIEGWRNLKNQARRNPDMDIDYDILYSEEN